MRKPTSLELRDIAIAKVKTMSPVELVKFLVKHHKFVEQYMAHKLEGFNGPQPFRN